MPVDMTIKSEFGRTALARRFRIFRTMMISKRIGSVVAMLPPTALAIIISPVDESDGTVGGGGRDGSIGGGADGGRGGGGEGDGGGGERNGCSKQQSKQSQLVGRT